MMASFYRFLKSHRREFLLYGIALTIRLAFAVPFIHDWDGFVFSESAKNLLRGETPYQTVIKNDPSIYPDSDKPMIQQWYAYPPLPLLMFTASLAIAKLTGLPLTELTKTLLLKLPFILGDLLAAWLVKKFLENKHDNMAKRAELLVLFNPLLIWVSSAWGMFDIWMANFLLLFLLAIRKQRLVWAGIYLALACTTKLFPVFFLPVIVIYAFGIITSPGQRWRLAAAFGTTLALVVVPFFLSSPRGFLNQNLLMHLQRPPQGLSLPAIYEHYRYIYRWPDIGLSGVGSAMMYLTMAVAILRALAAKIYSEQHLLWSIVIIYTSMLLLNKVSNEQYFVLLVAFLTILLHFPRNLAGDLPWRLLKTLKLTATYGVLVAAALLGFHFLGFLLPGLTQEQFRSSTNQLVFYLSRHFRLPLYSYPDSALTYYNLPMTIASVAMIPFIVSGLFLIWTEWRGGWDTRSQIAHQLMDTGKQTLVALGGSSWKVKLVIILLVLAGFSSTSSVKAYIDRHRLFMPVSLLEDRDIRPLPEHPRVGIFYNVWWNNFSHYKDFPYGDWNKTTLTPQGGYYTSKNSYFVEHIQQMRQAGIDFALVSYHLYDRERYLTFGEYAEKLGLYYAPLIETGDVLGFDKFRPVGPEGKKILGFSTSEESRKELGNIIISSLIDSIQSPAFFRLQDKPAIFVYDGHWFYPSWDKDYKLLLANRIVQRYSKENPDVLNYLTDKWQMPISSAEDIMSVYPKSIEQFNSDEPNLADFRQAFIEEYEKFWRLLKQQMEEEIGPIFLLTTYTPNDPLPRKHFVVQPDEIATDLQFDSEYFYSLANTWVAWRFVASPAEIKSIWERQVEAQAARSKDVDRPLFLTVTGAYSDKLARPKLWFEILKEIDGKNTYDWTWETALQYNPDYILITSWNEFFEGTAIEPSEEYGNYYIGKTAEWSQKFRRSVDQDIE